MENLQKLLLSLVVALFPLICVAQSSATISGRVVSEENGEKEGVAGVVIELISLRDTLSHKVTSTNASGNFIFKNISPANYRLITSLIGYKSDTTAISIKRGKSVTLPEIVLQIDNHDIDQVVINSLASRSQIKGDTISYNAAAYKVLPDADADELIEKIPGMKIENGKITTQGEEVKKILVDGKEFFGNNVQSALSTLPADAIAAIEVFDKLSDEAELSGIDDGNSYKTINIVTHSKMRTSITGKFNSTLALEPRSYDHTQHYANINSTLNLFRDKARTSLNLQFDNMNGNAQSKRGRAGVNYVNAWGKKDKLKLESSYNYNLANNYSSRQVDRDYFLSDKEVNSNSNSIYEHYTSSNNSHTKNNSHNINARIDYRITPRQRLTFRTQLTFNDSHSDGITQNNYFPVSGADATTLNSWNKGLLGNMALSSTGSYMIRLGEKAGRTINVNFGATYTSGSGDNDSYSEKSKKNTVRQQAVTENENYSFNIGVTYAEPLGKWTQATIGYNFNYRYSDSDKQTHLFDFENDMFFDEINPRYSNINNTEFLTQRTGPGFRFGKDGKSISGQLNYQHTRMSSDRVYPIAFKISNKSFQNLTYSINSRLKLSTKNLLTVKASSRTSNPNITQLQDVVNISNVNNIRTGNPNLKPSYTHQANINYTFTGVEKGTTFSVNFGGSTTTRLIIDSVVMNQPGYEVLDFDGEVVATLSAQGRFSKPVNAEQNWGINGGFSFAFPIKIIGCNFQFSTNVSLRQTPSILNGMVNYSNEQHIGGSVRLTSNFSKNFDFRINYSPTYSVVENSISSHSGNEYIRHQASGNLRAILNCGLTFQMNANYSQYVGLNTTSKKLNNEKIICDAALGMRMLKKRAELQFVVNDIFKQNNGFTHNINAQYTQISIRDIIGRYYGVKFTYNYRNFGKKRK